MKNHPAIRRIERFVDWKFAQADKIQDELRNEFLDTPQKRAKWRSMNTMYWFCTGVMVTLTAFQKAGLYKSSEELAEEEVKEK